jgi:hypothetical protein
MKKWPFEIRVKELQLSSITLRHTWHRLLANPGFPWVLLFLFVSLAVTQWGGTNAAARIAGLRAITETHSFRIDNYLDRTSDWSRAPDGHYYPNKAPGGVLLGLPVFALMDIPLLAVAPRDAAGRAPEPGYLEQVILVLCTQLLPFALLVLFLSERLARAGAPGGATRFFAVCALFGNTAAIYLNTYFGHGLAALLFLACFWFWLERRYALSAFFFGLCALTDYGAATVAPFFLLAVLARERSAAPLREVTKGALAPVAVWSWYHLVTFGGVFAVSSRFINPANLVPLEYGAAISALPSGKVLLALLFGPSRGLLFYVPWALALAVLPFARTPSVPRGGKLLLAGGSLALLWMNASVGGWDGGLAAGPRYLSLVFPSAAFLLALAWRDLPSCFRKLLALAAAASFAYRLWIFPFDSLAPAVNLWRHYGAQYLAEPRAGALARLLTALAAAAAAALADARRHIPAPPALAQLPARRDSAAAYLPAALLWAISSLLLYVPLAGIVPGASLLLWPGAGCLLLLVLRRLGCPPPVVAAVLFLVASHPALVNAVAREGSGAGLLSLDLLLAATTLALGEGVGRRERAVIFVLYAAAAACRPEALLWPLWWLAELRFFRNRSWREAMATVSPLLLPLAAAAAFRPLPPAAEGAAALADSPFWNAILAAGRAFAQLVFPLHVSPGAYDPFSLLGPLGIALFAAALAFAWYRLGRRTALLWLAPFLLTLAVVAIRPEQVFSGDGYLLWPAFGAAALLACGLARAAPRAAYAVLPFGVLLLLRALPLARASATPAAALEYAYRTEPSDVVKFIYTLEQLKANNWDEAMRLVPENLRSVPLGRVAFAETVLRNPAIPPGEKVEQLRRYGVPTVSYASRLALALARAGKAGEAYAVLRPFGPSLGAPDPNALPAIDDHAAIAAELLYYCRRAATPGECGMVERHLREQLGPGRTPAFERRLAELDTGGGP